MPLFILDRFFALLLFCLGVFVAWTALGYGYTVRQVPGPGFFPFWTGTLLSVFAAGALLRSFMGKHTLAGRIRGPELLQVVLLLGSFAAFILLAEWLGMWLAAFVFILANGLVLNGQMSNVRFLLIITVLAGTFSTALVYVFGTLLRVPLL
jgi:hypothetical protein